jgi:hypothetical protein
VIVAIREITRQEFDAYQPIRVPGIENMFEELLYYADETGAVIGLVARDRVDNDWGWLIIGRDEYGQFRAVDNGMKLSSEEAARDALITAMEELVASGQQIFPQ